MGICFSPHNEDGEGITNARITIGSSKDSKMKNMIKGTHHLQHLRFFHAEGSQSSPGDPHQNISYFNDWESCGDYLHYFEVSPLYKFESPSLFEKAGSTKVRYRVSYIYPYKKSPAKSLDQYEYLINDHMFNRSGHGPRISYLIFNPKKSMSIDDISGDCNVYKQKFERHLEESIRMEAAKRIGESNMENGLEFLDPNELKLKLDFALENQSPEFLIPGVLTPPAFSMALYIIMNRQYLVNLFLVGGKMSSDLNQYLVPVCVQGFWTNIPTSSHLAMMRDMGNQPASMLSTTANSETWPHYLEKAYIKSKFGYQVNAKRLQSHLYYFHDLTGVPYQEISLKKSNLTVERLEKILDYAITNNFIVSLSKDGPFGMDQISGIYTGCVYILTNRIALHTEEPEKKLIYSLMLNWENDHSPKKYEINKQEVVRKSFLDMEGMKAVGGIFVWSKEILEDFDYLNLYYHHPDNSQYCVEFEQKPEPFSYLELDIKQRTSIYVQLCQEELTEASEDHNTLGLKLIGFGIIQRIKREKETEMLLVRQYCMKARDVWARVSLEPGNYFIMVGMSN